MVEPYFTIVIPSYNRATYLRTALDSVLAQNFDSFEIIVVDDGSTDNTVEVMGGYRDSRIKYIRQPNSERAAARNTGIRMGRGVFTTFLDSDDFIRPNHLDVAKKFIDTHNPMIFHLGYDVCDSTGARISRWKPLPSPANWKLLEGNYLSCMGVFLNKEVTELFLFNEDRNLSGSEDYEYWLRLAAHYDFLTSPEVTGVLVNHEDRSVLRTDATKLINRIVLLKRYVRQDSNVLRKFGHSLDRMEAYLDIYVALHISLMKGMSLTAISYLFNSFRKFPPVVLSRRFWVIPKKIFLG